MVEVSAEHVTVVYGRCEAQYEGNLLEAARFGSYGDHDPSAPSVGSPFGVKQDFRMAIGLPDVARVGGCGTNAGTADDGS